MKYPALVFCTLLSVPAFAKDKSQVPCRAYFLAIEQDSVTVNLQMVGLNKQQSDWYTKRRQQRGIWEGVCLANLGPIWRAGTSEVEH